MRGKPKAYYVYFVCYLLIFALFLYQSFVSLDPDFGWHLRFGQLVLNDHSVPLYDQFSFTMPSYHFINHEWLLDTLQAFLFPFIGKMGLAVGFSLIALMSISLSLKLARHGRLLPILLIASSLALSLFVGVRDQVVSWVFFSLLLHFLYNQRFTRFRYLLPIVFWVWANIHGGFLLGIGVLWIWIITESLQKKYIETSMTALAILSTLITLINPYGFNLWVEIMKSTTVPSLTWEITEWMPLVSSPNLANPVLIAVGCSLLFLYRQRFSFSQKAIFITLLIIGVSHMRNFPFWLLFSLPLMSDSLEYLKGTAKTIPQATYRLQKATFVFNLILSLLFIPQVFFLMKDSYYLSENIFYPKQAVMYLRAHPSHKIFSTYNWGGYLIGNLPGTKVFIDGRMPHWEQAAKKGESSNALLEYQGLLKTPDTLKKTIEKYQIDTFLLPISVETDPNSIQILTELKQIHWHEVYRDRNSIIYRSAFSS